eukprot:2442525-Rhodomonas_salina.1
MQSASFASVGHGCPSTPWVSVYSAAPIQIPDSAKAGKFLQLGNNECPSTRRNALSRYHRNEWWSLPLDLGPWQRNWCGRHFISCFQSLVITARGREREGDGGGVIPQSLAACSRSLYYY